MSVNFSFDIALNCQKTKKLQLASSMKISDRCNFHELFCALCFYRAEFRKETQAAVSSDIL